ncbi:MAG: 2-C-methyl-D-erythritol 4-phosphate cytidylyltransferase, partial [Malacoplasma sp.]|nr:2-C-methyl-D-erythritol 4-phosphate cytidylyltransferase [Malacoplasma sp.]
IAWVESEKEIKNILDRKKIFLEQTPQAAKFKIFNEIYFQRNEIKQILNTTNDFCELALILNKKIEIVNGSILNFKITNRQDLFLFKRLLNSKK